jgi:hypothetical protein
MNNGNDRFDYNECNRILIICHNLGNTCNKGIKLLLNADDPFVSRLKIASDSIVYYGMKAHAHEFETIESLAILSRLTKGSSALSNNLIPLLLIDLAMYYE